MNLTIINQFYKPDLAPTATLAASLAEHRARLGDRVTIIAGKGGYTGKDKPATSGSSSQAAADPRHANPSVRRVWTPGLGKASHLKRLIDYFAFYVFAFFKLLTMPRQDVIIALTTPPLIGWAATFHKLIHPRTKLILWNMDCYPDLAERSGVMKPFGFWASRCRARNRALFRKLDHLVCLDSAMAHLLCSQYAQANPRLPVSIVPNWEEAAFFPPDRRANGQTTIDKFNLQGRFVVLYMGNMGYGHHFDTVLEAAEQLKSEPISFLFSGGGKRAPDVQREIERRALTNVHMQGYVEDKQATLDIMAAADLALVTLRNEILGVMSPSKIHANLAQRLPLLYIGPATSNVDEAILQHGVGQSIRIGDVAGVVAFIRSLLSDRQQHDQLRQRARTAFDSAYCDAATLPRFDAVINHAMGTPSALPTGIPAGLARDFATSATPSHQP